MTQRLLIIALLALLSLSSPINFLQTNQHAVIGIISTPDQDKTGHSFIKSTYVEFLQSAGANVIPIPWDLEEDKFITILESINGLLFPGGSADLWETTGSERSFSNFQLRMQDAYDLAMKYNRQGHHFPILGIGQGLEVLALISSQDAYLLDSYTHDSKLDNVRFYPTATGSLTFTFFSQQTFNNLEQNKTMYYNHHFGVNLSAPSLYPSLGPANYMVLAYCLDDAGKPFIAAMESILHPVFMMMFHPEQVLYEYTHNTNHGGHSSESAYAAKYIAEALITEASKNVNQFENHELRDALLIKNFNMTQLGDDWNYYVLTKNSLDEKFTLAEQETDLGAGKWNWFIVFIVFAAAIYIFYAKFYHKEEEAEENEALLKLDNQAKEDYELKERVTPKGKVI